ncbi:MAG: CHAT domain-containing protein, partial [Sodalinema sp.]|uniref:CHAT domain-containing protein n=1 Tax=Sodalinema sp. TaxID=3080550 RepID=UPI00396F5512
HLSPAQISTFLLRPHQDPHIFTIPCDPPGNPHITDQTNFREWLKTYSQLYQEQRKRKPTDLPHPTSPSPRREQLPRRLNHLKQILKIREIEDKLDPNDSLILIPHRDLHLLPLHHFFTPSLSSRSSRAVSYRPHLSLSCPSPPPSSNQPPILIGSPSSEQPLEFARLETQLIQQLYPQAQPLSEAAVTAEAFRQQLQTPAPFFYFSGHGEHDSTTPEQSALYLAEDAPFTLTDLDGLDSVRFPLVCLAACETGISNWGEFINEFVGFPAVFLNKGSGAVLSTLWTVSEVSSMIFIMEFFRHYQQQLQPTAALQHAQRQLRSLTWRDLAQWYRDAAQKGLPFSSRRWLQSCDRNIRKAPRQYPPEETPYRHPYHWAGFILTQSGRPLAGTEP